MQDLFATLANGTVDIMLYGATHTMERSVYLESVKSNFAFSIPYMYGGIQAAGDPFYVKNCADKGMKHLDECKGLRVCALQDSTHHEAMRQYLPERHIVPKFWDIGGMFYGYLSGECNVLVNEGVMLSPFFTEHVLILENATKLPDNFTVGTTMFSNEPNSAVTRTDDPTFSDFVSAIINGLMAAEVRGITQDTARTYPAVTAFGQEYKDMMRDAIASSGNYGEIYSSQIEIFVPRQPLNTINIGDTGLLYPHPFGFLDRGRNGTPLGHLLTKILQRGRLHCGISVDRPGFASRIGQGYSGMEVDFCRAISASLFQGDDTAVDFVEIQQPSDGFALLADEAIDVLAGVTWTLQDDVREARTGIGYSFSQPYFYGYSPEQDNLCLATRQEDSDWSNFVYWVLTGTLSAEYNRIDSIKSSSMPEVFVFGEEFKRMFRDSILIVGNYADIYERHLEGVIPRGGRNVLNRSGPQHYVLPGII
jgi:ABC-type amino acid transport substrate-binding protein